jgi:hypothetical protein
MASEHTWASVGKVLTAATAVVGLAVGLIQIGSALSGPDIVAIVEQRENVLPPKLRDELTTNIPRGDIKSMIDEGQKKKESPQKVLQSIKERVEKEDKLSSALFSLDALMNSTAWHITILNKSDEAAKDVRILFPGSGKADVIEGAIRRFDIDKKQIEWTKEIPIGSVPPNGTVQLLVWPEDALSSLLGVDIGLVHDGGSGVVRRWQKFYGWDSDFVAWFLAQSFVVRWVLTIIVALLIAVFVWKLYRRGHLVLRPPRREVPEAQHRRGEPEAVE